MSKTPEISIVIPILNEEKNVDELCDKINTVLKQKGLTYEVIFVDDSSIDNTFARLEKAHINNPEIKVIQMSRRFGYQTSIFAGLKLAQGEFIVTMDSDLQHPPEYIPKMIEKCKEGYDVVNMVRLKGQKKPLQKIGSKIFYKFINFLSPTPLTPDSADFRMYSKQFVEILTQFPERELFLRGIVGWIGNRQIDMQFHEGERRFGESKFSLWKSIKFAADAIVSFSTAPLFAATFLGTTISLVGLLYAIYIIAISLISATYPPGWPTTVCIVLIVGGLNMILIGIIGIYIAKMFAEAKGRPRYIITRSIGIESD